MDGRIVLDDVVLYDIMYEAGTRLGGAMANLYSLAKSQNNEADAEKWIREQQRLQQERASIRSTDADSQIRAYERWNGRAQELYRLIDEKSNENTSA